jgi:hypothetical protein
MVHSDRAAGVGCEQPSLPVVHCTPRLWTSPFAMFGLDRDGAELRLNDRVAHDFGNTGTVTGFEAAEEGSGLLDQICCRWDRVEGDATAPPPSVGARHLKKIVAPAVRVARRHTGAEFESGDVHRARGVNDADMERLRERERQAPLSPPRAPPSCRSTTMRTARRRRTTLGASCKRRRRGSSSSEVAEVRSSSCAAVLAGRAVSWPPTLRNR